MAASKFFNVELGMQETNIKEVKMSKNNESAIMWITVNDYTVKKMFIRAQYRRSKNISVINYFPLLLWRKKCA